MLTYCRGTDLDCLADHLLEKIEEDPSQDPLAPEIFIVQNYAMAQWLSLYMAERRGIAANLAFEFPAERVWSLIRAMDPTIPEKLPSERDPMRWKLMEILQECEDSPLERLRQYTRAQDGKKEEMRRWMLTGRIADLFDEYLTYRPRMLLEWENENLITGHRSEEWQAFLWRKLVESWKSGSDGELRHRAHLQFEILEALEKKTVDREKLPSRIFVFGVSSMPPVYLDLLVSLSGLTDLFFYVRSSGSGGGNALAESMARAGREYEHILDNCIKEKQVDVKKINPGDTDTETGRDTNLFRCFKAKVQGLDAGSGSPGSDGDRSIQIHSCHSARREVEVLYDRLLAMFDNDPDLDPGDVLVLAPDLETYAPEVEAVFSHAEEEVPPIPFYLADRSVGEANLIQVGFARLLELVESRFKVSDVLDLLDIKPVREKFGFTDENLNILERWIADNRIRWGINGRHKTSWDLPDSAGYTWQSGLYRMMAGYAMKQENDNLFNGISPYREVDQSDQILLAGKFSRFMHLLFKLHKQIDTVRPLRDWSRLLGDWMNTFFPGSETYFSKVKEIEQVISDLGESARLSGFDALVSFRIIRSYLAAVLDSRRPAVRPAGRGVVFSSLVSMQQIPAKVICLLGMNETDFPRSKISEEFNLIARNQRPGDRSHSRDDRQFFWEALLSADQGIYLSYIGQSERRDRAYAPSVVVQEVIDYLTREFGITEKDLLTKHRLQSFSPHYFKEDRGDEDLFSYSRNDKFVAEELLKGHKKSTSFLTSVLPEPDPEYKRLSLEELVHFYRHPAKYLLQNRFGLYLSRRDIPDDDREAFRLDNLEKYKLGQQLLDRTLQGRSAEQYRKVAIASNVLPEGWPGELTFQNKSEEVEAFTRDLQARLAPEEAESREIDLSIDDFRLTGRLDDLYGGEYKIYRFGKMRPADMVAFWLKHLALQAQTSAGDIGESHFYARDPKGGVTSYQLLPAREPRAELSRLLKLYWRGLTEKLCFLPSCSFAYAEAIFSKEKQEDAALKKAKYLWKNDFDERSLEGDDPYNKILYGSSNPLHFKEFKEISILLWKPFLSILKRSGE